MGQKRWQVGQCDRLRVPTKRLFIERVRSDVWHCRAANCISNLTHPERVDILLDRAGHHMYPEFKLGLQSRFSCPRMIRKMSFLCLNSHQVASDEGEIGGRWHRESLRDKIMADVTR